MSPFVIFTLVVVVFSGNGAKSFTHEYPNERDCKNGAEYFHDAAARSTGVVDVGTACFKSEFDQSVKPRA